MVLVFVLSACRLFSAPAEPSPIPQRLTATDEASPPLPETTPKATVTNAPPNVENTPTQVAGPTADTTDSVTPQAQATDTPALDADFCSFDPAFADVLDDTTAETWLDWIEKLSGAEPVIINGEETTIQTRYSISMFDGSPNARAFEFVHQQVLEWYPADQVQVMEYDVTRQSDNQTFTWQNLIVTIPGQTSPEEVVILSAHLDSTSDQPEERAPGAEDNGSGSAALLEAARVLKDARFERTVQIIWFTGEELGLFGSRAFVEEIENPSSVIGVVNLDMFGYDTDNDRCFEMHVGTLPQSDKVGRCFTAAIDAYDLDLPNYDYLDNEATDRSDHGSFWRANIGAIEILENMFDNDLREEGQPNACSNGDMNPNYHTTKDTVDALNGETGVQIVRAAIAAIAGMAQQVEQP